MNGGAGDRPTPDVSVAGTMLPARLLLENILIAPRPTGFFCAALPAEKAESASSLRPRVCLPSCREIPDSRISTTCGFCGVCCCVEVATTASQVRAGRLLCCRTDYLYLVVGLSWLCMHMENFGDDCHYVQRTHHLHSLTTLLINLSISAPRRTQISISIKILIINLETPLILRKLIKASPHNRTPLLMRPPHQALYISTHLLTEQHTLRTENLYLQSIQPHFIRPARSAP